MKVIMFFSERLRVCARCNCVKCKQTNCVVFRFSKKKWKFWFLSRINEEKEGQSELNRVLNCGVKWCLYLEAGPENVTGVWGPALLFWRRWCDLTNFPIKLMPLRSICKSGSRSRSSAAKVWLLTQIFFFFCTAFPYYKLSFFKPQLLVFQFLCK